METPPPLWIPLGELDGSSVAHAGGKAASLGELTRAGFAVPAGGVVTTAAFELFLATTGLDGTVERIHASLASGGAAARDLAGELDELRARVVASPLPDGVVAVLAAADALDPANGHGFAVRSSGVCEDGAGASFAGLYETHLAVRGLEPLADAVRRCWASAFHERVLHYAAERHRAGIFPMAVVVQEMVEADVSGVLFTLNPLTGRETEALVEAVRGRGEALVSGRVQPDRYVLDPGTGAVRESAPADPAAGACLDDGALRELAEMGAAIQEHYGRPMDVEWVRKDGVLQAVQARPITAIAFAADVGEWTTADFRDGGVSSDVCSPFMWSLYELALEHSMPRYFKDIKLLPESYQAKWGRMFFARPYWNLAEVKNVVARIPGFCERNFDVDLGIEVSYEGPGRTTPMTLAGILRSLPVLFALKRSYRQVLADDHRFRASFGARCRPYDLDAEQLLAMPDAAFGVLYRRLVTELYFDTETSYFTTIYNTSNSKLDFKVHFEKANRACGGTLSYLNLVIGLQDLSHLRLLADLHDVAGRLRAAGSTVNDATVRSFAARWRHHGRRELDIRVPRYADDLPFVRHLLVRAIETWTPDGAPTAHAHAQHEQYLAERAKAGAALRFRPLARRAFEKGLDLVRAYAWWREEMRDHSSRAYDLVRRFTVAAAGRLVARGAIAETDDVWYLTYKQAIASLEGALDPTATRRAARAGRRMVRSFRKYRNPNEVRGTGTLESHSAPAPDGAALLRGTGCSPGRAQGRARVLRDIEEMDRLEPGDVLVARFTDPGWTPLFSIAAAVVTEAGGLLSHAALVSREYGIPAVLAVSEATTRIPDGATVVVDGSAGTVELGPKPG